MSRPAALCSRCWRSASKEPASIVSAAKAGSERENAEAGARLTSRMTSRMPADFMEVDRKPATSGAAAS